MSVLFAFFIGLCSVDIVVHLVLDICAYNEYKKASRELETKRGER